MESSCALPWLPQWSHQAHQRVLVAAPSQAVRVAARRDKQYEYAHAGYTATADDHGCRGWRGHRPSPRPFQGRFTAARLPTWSNRLADRACANTMSQYNAHATTGAGGRRGGWQLQRASARSTQRRGAMDGDAHRKSTGQHGAQCQGQAGSKGRFQSASTQQRQFDANLTL